MIGRAACRSRHSALKLEILYSLLATRFEPSAGLTLNTPLLSGQGHQALRKRIASPAPVSR